MDSLIGTERARSEFTYHDVVDEDVLFLGLLAEELPVLAGMEARVATRHGSRARKPSRKVIMAEEGAEGAESSKYFVACMKDHFVLIRPHRPAEQKEGRSTTNNLISDLGADDSVQDAETAESEMESMAEILEQDGSNTSLLNIVSQSLDGVD